MVNFQLWPKHNRSILLADLNHRIHNLIFILVCISSFRFHRFFCVFVIFVNQFEVWLQFTALLHKIISVLVPPAVSSASPVCLWCQRGVKVLWLAAITAEFLTFGQSRQTGWALNHTCCRCNQETVRSLYLIYIKTMTSGLLVNWWLLVFCSDLKKKI